MSYAEKIWFVSAPQPLAMQIYWLIWQIGLDVALL
jgi:hypothetical protein